MLELSACRCLDPVKYRELSVVHESRIVLELSACRCLDPVK